jgi:1-acyl-sn-glycerol-3-phosphate acyltransferase
MIYYISRFICFLLFKILFRVKVSGREHIPKQGGFILAGNHWSYLDPVGIGIACQRRLNFMAKLELFPNPLFSWLLLRLGCIPVKRDSPDKSALKESIRRLENGEGLLLFPEGSRGFDERMPEPQAGIGFLAAKVNVPVIPAFIKGTEKALPKGAKFIRPKKVSVYFGEQISVERRMPYKEIALRIMEEIRRLSC